MIQSATARLKELVDIIPSILSEKDALYFMTGQVSSSKWNKLQILGHLIDSAHNNLQRFVRSQYEHQPLVQYDQNAWNIINAYETSKPSDLIELWRQLNRQIIVVLERMPEKSLYMQCWVSVTQLVPIHELVVDYVNHLEHHLKQIVDY